jgi:hypothetical protein
MPATLVLPDALLASTQAFLTQQGISLAAAAEAPADGAMIEVVQGARGQESAPTRLVAGGRIQCSIALGLAGRLGIPAAQVGALLDHLEVKVVSCSLGCF